MWTFARTHACLHTAGSWAGFLSARVLAPKLLRQACVEETQFGPLQPALLAARDAAAAEIKRFNARLFSGDDAVRVLSPLTGLDITPEVSLQAAIDACGDEKEYKDTLVKAALDFADDQLFMNGEDEHGMTRDQIGATCMYTIEGVYRKLSEQLRG